MLDLDVSHPGHSTVVRMVVIDVFGR